MTKRVLLQFSRSQDPRTEFYYIYRSTSPTVTKNSTRVMKVAQIKTENPIRKSEEAKRIDARTFELTHNGVIADRPFLVYRNGTLFTSPVYQVNHREGIILFDEDMADEDRITVDYEFDGIEVFDDFNMNPKSVEYYGPPASDNSVPTPPTNLSLLADAEGYMEVRFNAASEDSIGLTFYYAIEARSADGSFSNLSKISSFYVRAIVDRYIVETSRDDVSWFEAGKTRTLLYLDKNSDGEPPEPVKNLAHTSKTVTGGKEITLTWATPLANAKSGLSPIYRVRTKFTNGNISAPSATVGPETIKSNLDRIVILRRQGSLPPAYGDTYTETIADTTDYDSGSLTHLAEIGKTYSYSVFVFDKAGNRSMASTLIITT